MILSQALPVIPWHGQLLVRHKPWLDTALALVRHRSWSAISWHKAGLGMTPLLARGRPWPYQKQWPDALLQRAWCDLGAIKGQVLVLVRPCYWRL